MSLLFVDMVSYSLPAVQGGIGRFRDFRDECIQILDESGVAHKRDERRGRYVACRPGLKFMDGHYRNAGFGRKFCLRLPQCHPVMLESQPKHLQYFRV